MTIDDRKRYISILFLKKCGTYDIIRSHMKFSLKVKGEAYNISYKDLISLTKKYDVDNYIEQLVPLIDYQFTIEEMQEAIRFYSSGVGKKIIDHSFLQGVKKISSSIDKEMDEEFASCSKKEG